mgnify:CR=1 FL=1
MALSPIIKKSSLRISSLSESMASLNRTFNNSIRLTNDIVQTMSERNQLKRKSLSDREKYFNRRREAVRRKEQESIIEASSVSGTIKKTGKVVMDSTKGFLGRILDFVGTLLVGWLLLNLPRIIDGAKKLIERMQKLVTTLTSAVGNVTDFLFTFGQLLGGVVADIATFNFGNLGNTISDAMNKMNDSVRKLEQDVFDGIRLLTLPIDFGLDEVIDDASAGSAPSGGNVSGIDFSGVGENPTTLNEGAKLLMKKGFPAKGAAYIAGNIQQESGWNAQKRPWVLNDGAGTNKGLISWNRSRITAGEKFLGKPLEKATASEQIDWIKEEMRQYGVLKVFMDPNASEKQLKDASYKYIVWGDTGSRWKYSQSAYQYLLKEGSKKTTTIGPVQLGDRLSKGQDISGMISTKGVGYTEVTSLYGMRRGRLHKGIDIAAPAGTYIALRVDCEVVGTANDRGGYGLVIDVWVPQYGVQLRFGHCSKFLITSGKIPAGKSFAVVGSTGRSEAPHIHFEYTKEKNSTSKSDGDPSAYVPLILLTSYLGESASLASITKASAAQISVAPNKQTAQKITTERQGEEIVVIKNKPASAPVSPAAIITSGMNMIPGGRELNTFIKDVLFLNLANS